MKPLYCFTIFLGSFLLFAIQPMVGKMLLPSLGGTPAVWNTCVVFFQALLLLGYGYAHFGSSRLSPRVQVTVHLTLLASVVIFLPIGLINGIPVNGSFSPTAWLLVQLGLMVGLPFFVLSSNAPLIQRWYSLAPGTENQDPYFLYAFSNVGSLLALLAYPFLVEPLFGITQQSNLWMIAFLVLLTAFIGCGWLLFSIKLKQPNEKPVESASAVESLENGETKKPLLSWKSRFHFILLAAVPSSLMLGVTTFITTDVGSMPLLWVLPLALYLLTFVFAFSKKSILPHAWMVKIMPYMALLMAILLLVDMGKIPWLIAPLHLLVFFVVAMVGHGELAKRRPPSSQLTEFYFLMSIGGVVGGSLNGLIAPFVFTEISEYPLAIVFGCLLIPTTKIKWSWKQVPADVLWPIGLAVVMAISILVFNSIGLENKLIAGAALFAIPAIVCFSFLERRVRFALCLATIIFGCGYYFVDRDVVIAKRGFFGVNKVKIDERNGYRLLINGRTVHGIQNLADNRATEPLSYYHRTGPIGDIFSVAAADSESFVGVIGLGTGTIASYAQDGQPFDFYEIDPVVHEFASQPGLFSFLEKSAGDCRVIIGDARIQLQQRQISNVSNRNRKTASSYDLLILDAFSSDSIPTHLVTREAVELYFHNLTEDGFLALHITNKFVDLEPLLDVLAKELGVAAAIRYDGISGKFHENGGKESSVYVVMSRKPENLKPFLDGKWKALSRDREVKIWTDEYSNLFDVLKW